MAVDVKSIRYPSRTDTWKGVDRMVAEGWMLQGVKALAGGAYEAVFERACYHPPPSHPACSSRTERESLHSRNPHSLQSPSLELGGDYRHRHLSAFRGRCLYTFRGSGWCDGGGSILPISRLPVPQAATTITTTHATADHQARLIM